MKVYIIFGDAQRSDGDNIESIYFSIDKARERIDWLYEKHGDYSDFHIECFNVEE